MIIDMKYAVVSTASDGVKEIEFTTPRFNNEQSLMTMLDVAQSWLTDNQNNFSESLTLEANYAD